MILIADSGSTKTQWIIADKGKEIQSIITTGMNPNFIPEEVIDSIISSIKENLTYKDIRKIFFYGSGVSTDQKKKLIYEYLYKYFPEPEIVIEHDLLAAARAACGKEAGIAVILGTGSNSCYFDGEKIIANVPSLGYVLGDEGSGTAMGIQLIKAFIYKELPSELHTKFTEQFNLSVPEIIEHVYHKPAPNRFLAEFTLFIQQNIRHSFCEQLVKNSFNDFFIHHVNKYQTNSELCVSAVGSIAYHFQDILKEVAKENRKQVKNIYQSPCDGLLKYHSNE
jgi:glucosamine kinase